MAQSKVTRPSEPLLREWTDWLSGRFDDDNGGRRPIEREGLRQFARQIAMLVGDPDRMRVLTIPDLLALSQIASLLAAQTAYFVSIRTQQSNSAEKRGDPVVAP